MKALLIEWNQTTGRRAGGINPRDKGLKCWGWQNLDSKPALEIRVIEDGRDTTQYEGKAGVTVLKNDAEIQAAIDANIPTRYGVQQFIFETDITQKNVILSEVEGDNLKEMLPNLKAMGIKGIIENKPPKLSDLYPTS